MVSGSKNFFYLSELPVAEPLQAVADQIFPQLFRSDFTAPGFALLQIDQLTNSSEFRQLMLSLKEALNQRYSQLYDRQLIYLSIGRYDQQETTRFHLDGAPDESFLMLGYEPGEVVSELAIADYSRAAFDMGIEPAAFLNNYNPMFGNNEKLLQPYITRLDNYDHDKYQILFVNNSSQPFQANSTNQLGVMHQAEILRPSSDHTRIVDSILIGSATAEQRSPISAIELENFVKTVELIRKIYR